MYKALYTESAHLIREESQDAGSREQRLAEGQQVTQMIEFGGVVPERADLPYYLVSMAWYQRWQRYTGCVKVDDGADPYNDEMHIDESNQDSVILGDHPGMINSEREIEKLAKPTARKIFTNKTDFYGGFYLRDGVKEDEDFKVLDQQVWNILHPRYGGNELRRKSIAVPTENPERPDFIVEVQLRRIKIVTWPKVKYFPQSLSLEAYCSRTDTVKELITQICLSNEANNITDKMGDEISMYCRLWKMEGDETFQDVQECLQS